jgi:4-azaleucine resistance transporter AzlC
VTFDTTGMDFALTALIVVLFLEQWKKEENRIASIIGVVCSILCLTLFGADNLVLSAMVMILAVLMGGSDRLCK